MNIISKELKVYQITNMVIFLDVQYGLMQAVPKGAVRVYPFQSPNLGFKFVDIRSNNIIAQIADWAMVQDSTGAAWGVSYIDTLEKLCLFLQENGIIEAQNVTFDNVLSNLAATNVQDAIDELSQSYIISSTQWSRTLGVGVALNNGDTANGFTFFSDLTNRVAAGCTAYNEFFIRFTRKLDLSGASGTANINVGGVNYLITYNTTLIQTATDFVNLHALSIKAATGIVVAAVGDILRFGDITSTNLNTITITNLSGTLNGLFIASVGDHIVIPYTTEPYNGLRIHHNFRVNFDIAVGTAQTLALSLRRWADDSVIGSEIPIERSPDVAGKQETFLSYTTSASDPFVTGGFYFALRNNSGANVTIEGNIGVLMQNYFQKPVKF
ncbi:MAG: hypothetical protein ACK518_04650 [bacterium]